MLAGLAHGGVDQFLALGPECIADPARGGRVDSAHLDDNAARLQASGDAIGTQDRLLDVLGLGQHSDHEVAGGTHFTRCLGRLGAGLDQTVHRLLAEVKHGQFMPVLEDVRGHGSAHDAQADKSDFH